MMKAVPCFFCDGGGGGHAAQPSAVGRNKSARMNSSGKLIPPRIVPSSNMKSAKCCADEISCRTSWECWSGSKVLGGKRTLLVNGTKSVGGKAQNVHSPNVEKSSAVEVLGGFIRFCGVEDFKFTKQKSTPSLVCLKSDKVQWE